MDGEYACFNHLKRVLNIEEMEKVERIAFDLDTDICCVRSEGKCSIFLAPWKGIKTLYIGMKDPTSDADGGAAGSEFVFKDPSTKDEEKFMEVYRAIPSWRHVSEELSVPEALEWIRENAGGLYGKGYSALRDKIRLREGFCENVCPMLVSAI